MFNLQNYLPQVLQKLIITSYPNTLLEKSLNEFYHRFANIYQLEMQ